MVIKKERLTFTVEEAGELLGISRPVAFRMAKTGRLPVLRLGRRLLVPRAALERMLQEVTPSRQVE